MNEHAETALLNTLKSGEEREVDEALSQLYENYYEPIKQLVEQNQGTAGEAEDIFQETLYTFYIQVRQKQLQLKCGIQTFLYSIARNMWLDELRRRKRLDKVKETHTFITIEEDHMANMLVTEQSEQLAKVIGMLDEKCQQVLIYFYFDRYRMQQIAKLLGFANEQVAKNKKSKCLKKLKTLVEERRHQFEA